MSIKAYQINLEEMHKKIKVHRRKLITIGTFSLLALLVISIGTYMHYQYREFKAYQILMEEPREDSFGSKFTEFGGNILKYSNDGAFYLDKSNHLIWNQPYDMQEPMVDVCEEYAVIADKSGKKIYIADIKGNFYKIETNLPIQRIRVANQGVVAVLLKEGDAGGIQIFDKKGNVLVQSKITTSGSGFPLDLALSNDGKKMALSVLDYQGGELKTDITFYNLDTYGQNWRDNIVASYPYTNTVIPRIEFLTNDVLAAFGNNKILTFEGRQKPAEKKSITLKKEIHSIFYNSKYFGITIEKEKEKHSFEMYLYDLKGNEIQTMEFIMDYNRIEFLQNNEIAISNDFECTLFRVNGIERFYYKFKKKLFKIFSTGSGRNYILLLEGTTEKIRLK